MRGQLSTVHCDCCSFKMRERNRRSFPVFPYSRSVRQNDRLTRHLSPSPMPSRPPPPSLIKQDRIPYRHKLPCNYHCHQPTENSSDPYYPLGIRRPATFGTVFHAELIRAVSIVRSLLEGTPRSRSRDPVVRGAQSPGSRCILRNSDLGFSSRSSAHR